VPISIGWVPTKEVVIARFIVLAEALANSPIWGVGPSQVIVAAIPQVGCRISIILSGRINGCDHRRIFPLTSGEKTLIGPRNAPSQRRVYLINQIFGKI
jgi:hypothetical protein